MTEFNFAVIDPTGHLEVQTVSSELSTTLKALQTSVGGYVEAIRLSENGMIGWVNEDGYGLGLPLNLPGMAVLAHFGWTQPIVGPLVLTGEADYDAAGLTDGQLTEIIRVLAGN